MTCPEAARSGAATRPRLVDLVREAQQSVDRLTAERDSLVTNHRQPSRRLPGRRRGAGRDHQPIRPAGRRSRPDADAGPGLVVTLNDAQRDAEGRFPRDASPDDLVVHQQDIDAVLNALWSAGAEGIQMQDQRIIGTSAPRCVGNTLLLNGRTYSPPYVITAIGDAAAMQAALAAAPLVALYKQYVVRFGLGYSEQPRAQGRPRRVHRAGADEVRQADRPARLLSDFGVRSPAQARPITPKSQAVAWA